MNSRNHKDIRGIADHLTKLCGHKLKHEMPGGGGEGGGAAAARAAMKSAVRTG